MFLHSVFNSFIRQRKGHNLTQPIRPSVHLKCLRARRFWVIRSKKHLHARNKGVFGLQLTQVSWIQQRVSPTSVTCYMVPYCLTSGALTMLTWTHWVSANLNSNLLFLIIHNFQNVILQMKPFLNSFCITKLNRRVISK